LKGEEDDMRTRVLAMAAAAAFLAACGNDSCPTAAASTDPTQNMASACSAPAPSQVSINVHMCEACSHTAPTCSPQFSGTEIFLDTKWEVCTDNSSCSTSACADIACRFQVADGDYRVHTLASSGSTHTFNMTVAGGSPNCSGYL
jgi:hypothetical protein